MPYQPLSGVPRSRIAEAHGPEGRFRLVLVLDEAPAELVRLVGYLESMSGGLLSIDLIAVSVYQLGERSFASALRNNPQLPRASSARLRCASDGPMSAAQANGAQSTSRETRSGYRVA